jgi:preprotein translocase subunit SecA
VSETLSRRFQRAGIRHNVLNAKYHQREAEIVAEAGQPGAVTIATNMAGRGTDIKLGPGVTEAQPSEVEDPDGKLKEIEEIGGLHIVGSERHESRRIDRQLRGRAGRQGDPGASQFFLSLEDDLMRIFGSERIAKLMDRMGAQEGEVLTHPLITRSIEQAQKRVELQNFEQRKRLLEYDDVMNQQREVIYSLRSFALEGGEELKGEALKMVEKAIGTRVEKALESFETSEDWDFALLRQELLMHYLLIIPEFEEGSEGRPDTVEEAQEAAQAVGRAAFETKLTSLNEYSARLLSLVMLQVLDEKWKDHLYDLDQLRAAIHYRSWGQTDPLIEYKKEAYNMFVDLMADVYNTFTERFLRVQLVFEPPPLPPQGGDGAGGGARAPRGGSPVGAGGTRPKKRYNALGVLEDVPPEEPEGGNGVVDSGPEEEPPVPSKRTVRKPEPTVVGAGRTRTLTQEAPANVDWSHVGRSDPCPCGSGTKYKKCHGATV